MQEKVVIVENFYAQPLNVRELAMRSRYANIEATDYPGFASQHVLSTSALKSRFEDLISSRIVMDQSRFTWGGFRFVTEDSGTRAIVHADMAIDWAAMVYLTPNAPDRAGTGFYRHKASGFTGPPTDREARALGYADASDFDDKVIRGDKGDLSKWELIGQVAPRFNRLILFRGGEMYHAPLGGCGSDQNDARLAHIFFFNAVPRSRQAQAGRPAEVTPVALRSEPIALIAALKAASGVSDDPGDFAFVPCSSTALVGAGVSGLAEAAIASGESFQTAAQLRARGYGLDCLILVKLGAARNALAHWVIDGWSLLRDQGMGLDLRGVQLRGAQLAGANLERCDLSGADLSGADLQKCSLKHARLTGALLAGANLFSATLAGADMTEADLSRADLRHVDLRDSVCDRANFRGADIWNAYTWNVDFSKAFADEADLNRADNLTSSVKSSARLPKSQADWTSA